MAKLNMANKRLRIITLLLILFFVSACVLSIVRILFIPSDQVGIFGIGLPSKMVTYGDSSSDLSMEYPESWVLHMSREKSIGNRKLNVTINVPGRSFPSFKLSPITNPVEDITELVEDGMREKIDLPNLSEISLEQYATKYYKGYRREYSWTESTLLG